MAPDALRGAARSPCRSRDARYSDEEDFYGTRQAKRSTDARYVLAGVQWEGGGGDGRFRRHGHSTFGLDGPGLDWGDIWRGAADISSGPWQFDEYNAIIIVPREEVIFLIIAYKELHKIFS